MAPSHRSHTDIPEKANRVLNVILVAFLLITLRVWHLAVIQHDAKAEEARKPQKRTIVEAAKRATIRDRFNIPLAINKIHYNAAILYSQFRQIPTMVWQRDSNGKRIRRYKRKEYIAKLSQLLSQELHIDAERLEDLIHAKAAFYYHIPFVIKEDLTEQEYYRLKMLEKDWLGIHVQRIPKRTYPKGKVAADIIGYMGAINRQEYESIIHEMNALEEFLREEEAGNDPPLPPGVSSTSLASNRLKELQEYAYTINDYVGKAGIESRFEEKLRGFQGKKSYYSDARGNFLREFPGSTNPTPGERVLLSISAELQEYAENLLIQNEMVRQAYISKGEQGQPVLSSVQPWIKGGAIIAMDPTTGEILALASYPRFDPNDFISSGLAEAKRQKHSNIRRWFEGEGYLAEIWDQQRSLERERFNLDTGEFEEEGILLTWENYLSSILPQDSPVIEGMKRVSNLENAIALKQTMDTLLAVSGQSNPYWMLESLYPGEEHTPFGPRMPKDVQNAIEENLNWQGVELAEHKSTLNRFFNNIPNHYDKVLLADLCGLAVNGDCFSEALLKQVGKQDISFYRDVSAAIAVIAPAVRAMIFEVYHEADFKAWRAQHGKEFLKKKRAEEKSEKRYAKPYIDYLDAEENRLFQLFWEENRWKLLETFLIGTVHQEPLDAYSLHLSNWHQELASGAHPAVPWRKAYETLSNAMKGMPRHLIIPYLATLRTFKDLSRPLLGYYSHLRKGKKGRQLESHLAMAFYPVHGFGYGRSFAYRQATTQGSLFKLVTAYAALTQRYHQLELSGSVTKKNLNPLEIVDSVEKLNNEWIVGFHNTGQPIPLLYKGGRLPRSLSKGIGKINLIKAIEVSSNPYFALLAGDVLESPDALAQAARQFSYGCRTGIDLPAELAGKIPDDLDHNRTGLYALAIGQHSLVSTPLQTGVMLSAIANGGSVFKPRIVRQVSTAVNRQIFMPNLVQDILLEGMKGVLARMYDHSLRSLSQLYHEHPEAISDLVDLQEQLIGKTSTAESVETLSLDSLQGTKTCVHTWFGGISFNPENGAAQIAKDHHGRPELVVIVYLRFGKYGWGAAPLAAQIINKWREIRELDKRRNLSYNSIGK